MTPEEQKIQDIRDLKIAIFGDEEVGQIGMMKKVDALYEVFSALLWIGKVAAWGAVILAGVGAVWTMITHYLRQPVK